MQGFLSYEFSFRCSENFIYSYFVSREVQLSRKMPKTQYTALKRIPITLASSPGVSVVKPQRCGVF